MSKPFLKRVNRGLLLAAAVFLILVVYLVVDGIVFIQSRPKVLLFLEEYARELSAFNTGLSEYAVPGDGLPQDKLAQKRQDAAAFRYTYYDERALPGSDFGSEIYGFDKFITDFGKNYAIKTFKISYGKVTEYEKLSPHTILLSVVVNVDITYCGTKPEYLFGYSFDYVYDYENSPQKTSEFPTVSFSTDDIKSFNTSFTETFTLSESGGKYRIIEAS